MVLLWRPSKWANSLTKMNEDFIIQIFVLKCFFRPLNCFFLADKMIIPSEDGFFGKRVQVSLSYFLPESYKDIISDACTKLFRRCVESVCVDASMALTWRCNAKQRIKLQLILLPMEDYSLSLWESTTNISLKKILRNKNKQLMLVYISQSLRKFCIAIRVSSISILTTLSFLTTILNLYNLITFSADVADW